MNNVAKIHVLDRLSACIPLIEFSKLDVTQPALVRVLVDSEIASKMLSMNLKNRRQRRTAVEYLKQQIKSSEWRDDHPQPIIFSDRGRLIDGQHRLQAISESKIDKKNAVIVRVETGARDDVREYLDTGVPRTLDDRVELVSDNIHNKTIAQLITYATTWDTRKKRPTPEEAREFFTIHEESCLFVAKNHKKEKGTGRIQVAYAAMQYYEIDLLGAIEFYPAIFVADSRIQQARMLRDWLLRAANTKLTKESCGSWRNEIYYRSVSCMKAHMSGKHISVIRKATW